MSSSAPTPSCFSIKELSSSWCPLSHPVLPVLLHEKQRGSEFLLDQRGQQASLRVLSWLKLECKLGLCVPALFLVIHSHFIHLLNKDLPCASNGPVWATAPVQAHFGQGLSPSSSCTEGKGSVCVSPFCTFSSLFPAYSFSFFFLPGASPPTQPRSDEVNNQGVSFKYKLAQ